jgi:Pyridoxamine 5'-phosphate oxidase
MDVEVTQLRLPDSYGHPTAVLEWGSVDRRLAAADHYWLASTRPDGRPHTVPVDGLWWQGALYFGGDPATVHVRNLRRQPGVVVHTESAETPVILEGRADWHVPTPPDAASMAAASVAKYGYATPAEVYRAGVWRLSPVVVIAWTVLFEDATRFTFSDSVQEAPRR